MPCSIYSPKGLSASTWAASLVVMAIYEFEGDRPTIGKNVYISPDAVVIGRVFLGDHASVWPGAILRGDLEPITIGDHSNVQDGSVLHTSKGIPLTIGNGVTLGHGVVVHSCTIGDRSLVGMGSTLLDNVIVGTNSVVAAGSVLPPGKQYGDGVLVRGNPGKEIRALSEAEYEGFGNHYKSYIGYLEKARTFREISIEDCVLR